MLISLVFDESVTNQPINRHTDRPTDGPTDGPTDRPSYRDARTHLKIVRFYLPPAFFLLFLIQAL